MSATDAKQLLREVQSVLFLNGRRYKVVSSIKVECAKVEECDWDAEDADMGNSADG